MAIEFRYAENQYVRLPALAADLVRRPVDVVVAHGIPVALAARAASTKTPVVFLVAVDPVKFGFVASFSRPDGNLIGMTMLGNDLGPKRLELLHELVPSATTIAALINPTSPIAQTQSRDLQAAARTLGVQLHVLHASNEHDFDTVFARLAQLRAEALVIDSDVFFSSQIEQLATLAFRNAMPAIYQFRSFAAAGGLTSYGVRITSAYLFVGVYTGQILNGETPADLPVQQSTEVELTINLRTDKALGLTVPLPLLARADEMIE